jgi:hypothetical protein
MLSDVRVFVLRLCMCNLLLVVPCSSVYDLVEGGNTKSRAAHAHAPLTCSGGARGGSTARHHGSPDPAPSDSDADAGRRMHTIAAHTVRVIVLSRWFSFFQVRRRPRSEGALREGAAVVSGPRVVSCSPVFCRWTCRVSGCLLGRSTLLLGRSNPGSTTPYLTWPHVARSFCLAEDAFGLPCFAQGPFAQLAFLA